MDDNMNENIVMGLDLDQQPLDPHPPVGSVSGLGLLSDLETTHHQFEDRIQRLEEIVARARQTQPTNPQTIIDTGPNNLVSQETTVDLESFYDCNICLEMAREPILTCCGHLFCWACFYQLPRLDSSAKECPVCRGEVSDTNVTPIYGNGSYARVSEAGFGLKVPPRPRAHRVESVRPRAFSHIQVAEALRRIRSIGVGATWEHTGQQDVDGVSGSFGTFQFSRALSETAASFSSISSALNNAERLVEDLETYIHVSLSRRSNVGDLSSNAAVVQSDNQNVHSTPEVNSEVPVPSSSSRRRSGVSRVSDVDNGVPREPRRRRLR